MWGIDKKGWKTNTAKGWHEFIGGFCGDPQGQGSQCPANTLSGLAEEASYSDVVLLLLGPLGVALLSVFQALSFRQFINSQYPSVNYLAA